MIVPAMDAGYEVETNRESGDGRADILLYHRSDKRKNGVILEFKTETRISAKKNINSDDDLKELAQVALQQIEDKAYASRLKGRCDEVCLFGVAVLNKFVYVESSKIKLH